MTTQVSQSTGLDHVSKALQAVHKHLLTFQTEQTGFNGSPLQLFDRVTKDGAFAWLKPLRDTIVSIDQRLADEKPISDEETKAFGNQCRSLLDAKSGPFRDGLNAAYQSHPEAILAVATARRSVEAIK
ncbi:hypothetical protein FIV00_09455 [Labrenzia sp. THAF82]|uniref:hypothetical protein n=1 Tax=Labrenzia sp. THAF82 TaxID=2587861 RepID=UPI00126913B0|nr:hypothetical protein [Labrenzia sp. THAF82]QFT30701.1 hypothetical protein FIV00_09455 [Labrenzia sp. THAF82]